MLDKQAQARSRNRLMRALDSADFERVRPHLTPVHLPLGTVLVRPGEPITKVHFFETALGSVVTRAGLEQIEIGVAGREGLSDISVILGPCRSSTETVVQIAGDALEMPVASFRAALEESPALHALMLRYVQARVAQIAETALSNGRYTVVQRLARWVLASSDAIDSPDLALTHQFISIMLGVRRAGVTLALHELEGEKAIVSLRGLIRVVNRDKLEAIAAGSYGQAEAEFKRLIG